MKNQSLAEYISTLREQKGYSQLGLANAANIDLSALEEVESGQLLFLPTVVRQKLAKALKVEPRNIKKYERNFEDKKVSDNYLKMIKDNILQGELEGNICPECGSELICRVAELYDLEDRLVKHPKAHCSKCSFQIK
ncbi:MAG: helix-turn-helix transcriptional regulator [Candidatus Gastranaerophilales bacterium]|nr:helix-turn-helix transcriptional regulator [Candidatus Gastranaerophilales bacterium]